MIQKVAARSLLREPEPGNPAPSSLRMGNERRRSRTADIICSGVSLTRTRWRRSQVPEAVRESIEPGVVRTQWAHEPDQKTRRAPRLSVR